MKEWTTTDCRNTSSNINIKEEGIVDDLRKDGNASMTEQVKRPNPWKRMTFLLINENTMRMAQLKILMK